MSALLFAASLWHYVFGLLMFSSSLFLILLVLVQRGRGGGLTGALGGMGGQSAFGAKAGDTFTRVTVVTATIWILIAVVSIKVLGTVDMFGTAKGGPSTIGEPITDSDNGDAVTDDSGEGATGDSAGGESNGGDDAGGVLDADQPSATPADDPGSSEEGPAPPKQ